MTASRTHAMPAAPPPSRTVAVIGAGNTGSFAVGLLARVGIGRLIVVDPDHYEARNLRGQDVTRRDVGRGKAAVQAARARRIQPALAVEAIAEAVEDVPLGRLRAHLILSCVDSRAARLAINHVAWRLGVPLIDVGVSADDLLLRVEAYVPGDGSPCLRCAWQDEDYEAIEQTYACTGTDVAAAPATDAPAALGAAAAALLVSEAAKLLDGRRDEALVARQVVLDLRAHRHFVSALRRSPRCRFDHRTPRIETLPSSPEELTMGQVLSLAPVVRGVHGELALSVEGKSFLTAVHCPSGHGSRSAGFRLSGRLDDELAICGDCRRRRVATGFDRVERLSAMLPKSQLERRLSSFGFRPGDVLTLSTTEAEAHFELGGDHAARPRG